MGSTKSNLSSQQTNPTKNQIRLSALALFMACFLALSSPKAIASDTLTLGQAYVNLTLTVEYFDSINSERASSILSFEKNELNSIQYPIIRGGNGQLYHFSHSLWNLAQVKHLYRDNQNKDREALLLWKKTLGEAIAHLDIAQSIPYEMDNPFYEFIKFTNGSFHKQENRALGLKSKFTPYFNKDIYPDFKRIFLAAENDGHYYLDSLRYYCSLYSIPINLGILDGSEYYTPFSFNDLSHDYNLALALDLISRYLQLDFIAEGNVEHVDTSFICKAYKTFVSDLSPESDQFIFDDMLIKKDEFFATYLNQKACDKLYEKLQKRYPFYLGEPLVRDALSRVENLSKDLKKYYFPTPAPFPTAKIAIKDFKPKLKTLKEVDNHIRQCFVDAGYEGRLHYYYIKEPGFAISTGIERINKDGSPASGMERWDLTAGTGEGLSLYNVFKSMFFATESDYRMIACIVSEKEIKTTTKAMSMQDMAAVIKNSYSALPDDLEPVVLKDKTITVLLYHYTQNDVGKVPMLNQNTVLTVYDHLQQTSSLSRLTSN